MIQLNIFSCFLVVLFVCFDLSRDINILLHSFKDFLRVFFTRYTVYLYFIYKTVLINIMDIMSFDTLLEKNIDHWKHKGDVLVLSLHW